MGIVVKVQFIYFYSRKIREINFKKLDTMTNLDKIKKVNDLLIEVIKDEEHQVESSFTGL